MSKSILIVGSVLIILCWSILFMLPGRPTALNEFGDSFGIVNALFSGLGLLAIVYSLHLQMREIQSSSRQIDQQGQTIEELRKAIVEQTARLEQSVSAQTRQAVALTDLVDQYRLQLEPLKRRVDIAERQFVSETQNNLAAQRERIRQDLRTAWQVLSDRLASGITEYEAVRDAYEESRYRDAVHDAIAFNETYPETELLKELSPLEQKFLRNHLFRANGKQRRFTREAKALAGCHALGTVEKDRQPNYMEAHNLYQNKRTQGRMNQGVEYSPS